MAEYVANTPQVVAAGQAVILQTTTVPGNCDIRHRDGTARIDVRGSGCCMWPNVYRVAAHVVVTATATVADTPVQLALAVDGTVLPETTIALVPAAAGDILSGSTEKLIVVDGGSASISLVAITEAPITSAVVIVTE